MRPDDASESELPGLPVVPCRRWVGGQRVRWAARPRQICCLGCFGVVLVRACNEVWKARRLGHHSGMCSAHTRREQVGEQAALRHPGLTADLGEIGRANEGKDKMERRNQSEWCGV